MRGRRRCDEYFLYAAVFAANNAAKAVIPSLAVEGIDFDVTSLPQRSTMYFNDGKTALAEFYTQNREVVPLKKISKAMQQAVVAREDKRFFEHHRRGRAGRDACLRANLRQRRRPAGRFHADAAVREERAVHAGA